MLIIREKCVEFIGIYTGTQWFPMSLWSNFETGQFSKTCSYPLCAKYSCELKVCREKGRKMKFSCIEKHRNVLLWQIAYFVTVNYGDCCMHFTSSTVQFSFYKNERNWFLARKRRFFDVRIYTSFASIPNFYSKFAFVSCSFCFFNSFSFCILTIEYCKHLTILQIGLNLLIRLT